jgi:hypothetical protein
LGNLLTNPTLEDVKLAAGFDNNGTYGAVHVPAGWSFVYRSGEALKMIERPEGDQKNINLDDRPPQVHPGGDFHEGVVLETTSYTAVAGFRQKVGVAAYQRLRAGASLTAYVHSNEPSDYTVKAKIRIHHRGGLAEGDWVFFVMQDYGQEVLLNAPLIQPGNDGEIGYELLIAVRYPVVSAKVVVQQCLLDEVGREAGQPVSIKPFRTGTPLPDDVPTPEFE